MAGKRDKPEEIVVKLRQVEVLQGQGMSVAEAVRQIGVTVQTYRGDVVDGPSTLPLRGQTGAVEETNSRGGRCLTS